MVLTSSGYMSDEDDELGEDSNYLDIIKSPSYEGVKKKHFIPPVHLYKEHVFWCI
jgi:hypothetical protein